MPQVLIFHLCSLLMMNQRFKKDNPIVLLPVSHSVQLKCEKGKGMSQTSCFEAELLDSSVQLNI